MASRADASFAVLGAGSWGTALALVLAHNGKDVALWGHDAVVMRAMQSQRCNPRYLTQHQFPANLHCHDDLASALRGASDVLLAVPSSAFRAVLESARPHLVTRARVVWATKGLEQGSNKLLHDVAAQVLGAGHPLAVASGPTFAAEVAAGLPTAITVASESSECALHFARALHNKKFRAYTSDDVVGVELGGAIKNVLAIAAGIADGLGFGANTRAALITRGLAEMVRLGTTLGGRKETLTGLSGLGDLILSCTDNQSRNRRLGLALGQGQTIEQALAAIDQVVEGVQTAREVYELAKSCAVDMPITAQVYAVLYEGRAPRDAVRELLEREQKAE